jgi:hypothetical protein
MIELITVLFAFTCCCLNNMRALTRSPSHVARRIAAIVREPTRGEGGLSELIRSQELTLSRRTAPADTATVLLSDAQRRFLAAQVLQVCTNCTPPAHTRVGTANQDLPFHTQK